MYSTAIVLMTTAADVDLSFPMQMTLVARLSLLSARPGPRLPSQLHSGRRRPWPVPIYTAW